MMITCLNCAHYHSTLEDSSNPSFHIHDYCDIWNNRIPDDIIVGKLEQDVGYDDIECGYASCFAFEPKEERLTEAAAMLNREKNKKWNGQN